jgi:pSer/pThr/pTyr-binding forkhead associated (FHA) protein
MITCRVCNNQEFYGAFFCSECGSQIAYLTGSEVDTFVFPNQSRDVSLDISNTIPKNILETKELILFYPEQERMIDLPDLDEFTIGRYVEGQVIAPDVDLNPFEAFDKGVSRLHATIRINRQNNKVFVIDLGSANGSCVNGYEIPANSEVPLNNGDVLTLGKFNLKVILPKEMK